LPAKPTEINGFSTVEEKDPSEAVEFVA